MTFIARKHATHFERILPTQKMVAGHPVRAQSDRSVAWQHADANEGMPK
jgi:hypothetical protein